MTELSRLQTEIWTILETADTYKTAGEVLAPLATALRDSLRTIVPKPVAAPKPVAVPKPRKKTFGVPAEVADGPTLSISEPSPSFSSIMAESLDN